MKNRFTKFILPLLLVLGLSGPSFAQVPERSRLVVPSSTSSSWYRAAITPTDCSAPQYSFTDDTDTGFGYGGTNSGRLCAGGAVAATFTSSGNFTVENQIRGQAYNGLIDGVILLWNASGTDFSRLQFGGTTSSFPAIKRNGVGIDFRLADDSAYTSVTAGTLVVSGATLSSNVYVLQTTATNDDPIEAFRQARVTTTNATPTTLDTFTTSTSATTAIGCYVVARRTGGASGAAEDGGAYYIEVAVKNTAGTVAELAAETVRTIGESTAGFNVTAAASGATELIQVTGAATTDITWHSSCRSWAVGS